MRIALAQIEVLMGDKWATIEKAERMIREAVKAECDIIIFPEMSFTGFSMELDKIGESSEDSQTVNRMRELASELKIAIGFGWSALPMDSEEKGTNRFTFIDEDGEILAEYTKLHPFTYGEEDVYYEKGSEIVSFPYKGRNISLFVCYDLRFPEIFQIAAKKSDMMFVIANWPSSRSAQWTTLLRARAIETQSDIVGVNCVGFQGEINYSGDSEGIDYMGNILGRITGKEGILICNYEETPWKLRKKFSTSEDRREDFYVGYMKNEKRVVIGGKEER